MPATERRSWYLRRLRKMSVPEVGWRLSDFARQRLWATEQLSSPGADRTRHFEATLADDAVRRVPSEARDAVVSGAERLLAGRWDLLGATRDDMADPDWFRDPVTGCRAPAEAYWFTIDHRSEAVTGNVKQIWELSRMQHVTVLAAAYAFTRDTRYAERAESHLRSWWAGNPPLTGINWTCGIELGLRLISWVWTRRLLEGWDRAPVVFEDNPDAVRQVWWHQRYLAAFRSRGSSANNHVVAEAAGQLVASLAFDWFEESAGWRERAKHLLEGELRQNTFPSGVDREMAFDYHGFVAELGYIAAAEADRAGRPLSEAALEVLCRMTDVAAAAVDARLRAPRQGDGDDGRALVVGDPIEDRWGSLLSLGSSVFGPRAWWPEPLPGALSTLLASMLPRHPVGARPVTRPDHFDDAGMTFLRSDPEDGPEIWCRCDAGPHGFLSIAAHAHADALAVEVRHDGIDVLADPGTYCYNGEPEWRSYFRSTLGHNTVEIAGADQSESGGPTMWMRHAGSTLLGLGRDPSGRITRWSAEHDGYAVLDPPARHRRTVDLDSRGRRIEIRDHVESEGRHRIRLAFHLGPVIGGELDGALVTLRWAGPDGEAVGGRLRLDPSLSWSLVRGSTEPTLGWYSERFGVRQPSLSLVGEGRCSGADLFRTVLEFVSE